AMRGSVAPAHGDPCARQRGAVRLRPFGSTAAGRRREKVDMTDPHLRAAGGHVVPALAEPFVKNRRIKTDLAGGGGPAGQHFHLDLAVVGAEPPVGAAFKNRKAGAAKPLRRGPPR